MKRRTFFVKKNMYLVKSVIFAHVHLSLFAFKVSKIDIWQLIRKDKKTNLSFKIHDVTNRMRNKQITAIHIPTDTSRSKGN